MTADPLLIESIRIQNGRVRHIRYHNERCNHSRKVLFGVRHAIDLRKYIDTRKASVAEVKCRILYKDEVEKVEYQPYRLGSIRSLQQVEIGTYSYDHKFLNREQLDDFFTQKGSCDDILMTKKGWLTDTYYCNVALHRDGLWYTPEKPLLHGTSRARLIAEKRLISAPIHIDELSEYRHIMLFNSMIPFGVMSIAVDKINSSDKL